MNKQIDLKKTENKPELYTLLENVNSQIQSSCIIVDCAITEKGKYVVCAFSNDKDECIFDIFENAQDMDKRVHISLLEMFKNIRCEAVITDRSIGSLPNVKKLFKSIGIRQIVPKPFQRTMKINDVSHIVPVHRMERKIRTLIKAF